VVPSNVREERVSRDSKRFVNSAAMRGRSSNWPSRRAFTAEFVRKQTRRAFNCDVMEPLKHTQSGTEIVYILDGSSTLEVADKPPQTLKAGEAFSTTAGQA
jgi:hypothetical protein